MLNLVLPEGSEGFDAAVFDQEGNWIQSGHREACEGKAEDIRGLYCLVINGKAIIKKDFE